MENSIFKDCIKNYNDACKKLKTEPLTLQDFSPKLSAEKRQYLLSVERVTTVIEAKKEGKEFDWNDSSQQKRFPWWDMETYGGAPAGSGFSLGSVVRDLVFSNVGARLSSFTEDEVRDVVKYMLEDYRVIMKG